MTDVKTKGGPRAAEAAQQIWRDYLSETPHRMFLPAERLLTDQYGVARNTLRKALSLLAEEGLIRPERGRGYRILKKPRFGHSVARIAILQNSLSTGSARASDDIVEALRRHGLREGCQVLNVEMDHAEPGNVARTLINSEVNGVALANTNARVFEKLSESGIPCVALENSERDLPMDYVFQDNFGGAQQATRHLLAKGHTCMGWIGPSPETSVTSRERWLGAYSGLMDRGFRILPKHCANPKNTEAISQILMLKDRPTALLAMWQDATIATVHALNDLGLNLGKDIDVVGWCTEMNYSDLGMRLWSGRYHLPMVTWNTDTLAAVVVDRLIQRGKKPGLPPLNITVPATLKS